MVQRALVGPVGAHFLRRVRRDDRQLFAWTVNEVRWMEWCIRKNMSAATTTGQSHVQGPRLIDGVITDDPKLFLEVCDRWEEEADGARQPRRNPDGVVGDLKGSLQVAWQLLFFQVVAPLYYLHRRFIAKKMDLLTELDQGGSVDRGVAVIKSKPL
jgi:phosphatidylglycerol phospholipase C